MKRLLLMTMLFSFLSFHVSASDVSPGSNFYLDKSITQPALAEIASTIDAGGDATVISRNKVADCKCALYANYAVPVNITYTAGIGILKHRLILNYDWSNTHMLPGVKIYEPPKVVYI